MALSMWVNVDDPLSRKERVGIEDLEGRVIAMPGPGSRTSSACSHCASSAV